MSVIYIVFPLALLIAVGWIVAYVWASRSGQFDDMDTPAMRALHDEESTASRDDEPHEGPPTQRTS